MLAGRPLWTSSDSIALALNLARSLGELGRFEAADVMARHVDWFRSNRRGTGTFTLKVLARVSDGTSPWEDAARLVWEERGPEVSAGNGSVSYCAPLGAAYAHRPRALRRTAPALSALTHHDERCRSACLAVTVAVAAGVRGEPPTVAVQTAITEVLDREGGEELEFLVEAVGSARPVDGPDMGFCLFTAAAGLQALLRSADADPGQGTFERELRRVVALGGDTDSNAAVAGALLGATVGAAMLPEAWLRALGGQNELRRAARRLVDTRWRGSRRSSGSLVRDQQPCAMRPAEPIG